jgi:uncharacterized protein YndB with AHSA1/START domain
MKTEENPKLEIRRVLKAPRDRVYAAWSDPAQLKQWFGPETAKTRGLIADVRPGGLFRWDVIDSDGEEMTVRGEYREIIEGKKIAFSWQWDDDEAWENRTSLVTVELFDHHDGTELLLRHEQLPSEASRDRHHEGWSSVVDALEQFITTKQ